MWNLSMQLQLVRVILIWFTFTGICRYFKNSTGNLPILNQPVCTIPLGSWVPKIGDPNSRPLAMLRPHASLSSALNMLVQGMFCVHFPGTEYCMLEMQRLLWCSCLHFLWQLLFNSWSSTPVPLETGYQLKLVALLCCESNLLRLSALLVAAGVSSIPIVDENDSLLDTYSRRYTILTCRYLSFCICSWVHVFTVEFIPSCSDITALAKDKVYTHVRLEEMTIHQVFQ